LQQFVSVSINESSGALRTVFHIAAAEMAVAVKANNNHKEIARQLVELQRLSNQLIAALSEVKASLFPIRQRAITNPNDAVALQSSIVQPAFAKAADYSRSLFEISTESQQQFAQMLEGQLADFQKQVSSMAAQAAKVAPAGTEPYVAAMQKAIDSANNAFVNMMAMAKQINETVQANLFAATKMK
jgi:phasin family protein